MKAYLRAFINFKQTDWAKLLPIADFAYNIIKNTSTSHMPFELICGYYPYVFLKENTNLCSQFKTAKELFNKVRKLITVYWKNLYHTQKLQKQAHNKDVKPKSYAPNNKVWLNSKYIKTKQNRKL